MHGPTGKPLAASRNRGSAARGFTLLELVIVLAILAIMMAMVWPALRRPVMRHTVQQAARQLVRDLARARMAAIDSGRIVALRYESGGRRYVVTLAESLDERNESASEFTAENKRDTGAADEVAPDVGFEALLEEDVVFRDPADVDTDQLPPGSKLKELLDDERQETEEVQPLIDIDESDQEWSAPVFFYPTGRAENAELVLLGPDGYRLTVKIRGLTGAASIGPLEHTLRSAAEKDETGKAPERATLPDEFMEPDVLDK